MAKGKRSGHRAEDVIASHTMKHHDFIGGAEAERQEAERRKEEKVAREREQAVLHEMARANAGSEARASEPTALRADPHNDPVDEPRQRGSLFALLEDARDQVPGLLADLRSKAEERLAAMPRPVKIALHRGEQAAALLLAPARIGLSLAREVLRAPLSLLQALRRREA